MSFKKQLEKIKELGWYKEYELLVKHGYRPLAMTWMYFDLHIVYRTTQQALDAYNAICKNEEISKEYYLEAQWYGYDNFMDVREKYVQQKEKNNWPYQEVVWFL